MLIKTVCDGVDEQEMPRKMKNTSNINGLRKRSKCGEILRVENLDADQAASGLCSRITIGAVVCGHAVKNCLTAGLGAFYVNPRNGVTIKGVAIAMSNR